MNEGTWTILIRFFFIINFWMNGRRGGGGFKCDLIFFSIKSECSISIVLGAYKIKIVSKFLIFFCLFFESGEEGGGWVKYDLKFNSNLA